MDGTFVALSPLKPYIHNRVFGYRPLWIIRIAVLFQSGDLSAAAFPTRAAAHVASVRFPARLV